MSDDVRTEGVFFLDSGAHGLYNRAVKGLTGSRRKASYDWYDTDEFWDYVDGYAKFVKKHLDKIDYYATVDVIFEPKRSWQVLKYLEEEYGLNPVPVIHYGTPMKWIDRHLEAGYDLLGIGGLGQEQTTELYVGWADDVFTRLCPPPSRLPIVRTHGFAMTGYGLMLRYPWWSVDSATWTKVGAFGSIMVPHMREGKFTFDEHPYIINVSEDSPTAADKGKHYSNLTGAEKRVVDAWLELNGLVLGEEGGPVGVRTHHSERKIANLLYFEAMRKWMDENGRRYPWPFYPPYRRRRMGVS